jgi:hypothetical protein
MLTQTQRQIQKPTVMRSDFETLTPKVKPTEMPTQKPMVMLKDLPTVKVIRKPTEKGLPRHLGLGTPRRIPMPMDYKRQIRRLIQKH